MLKQYRYEEVGPDGSTVGFDFTVNSSDFIAAVENAMEDFIQFLTFVILENEKGSELMNFDGIDNKFSKTEMDVVEKTYSMIRGNVQAIAEIYICCGRYTRAMERALLIGSPQPTVYGPNPFMDEVPFTPPTIRYVGEVQDDNSSIPVKRIEEIILKGPLLVGYLNASQLNGLDVQKNINDVLKCIDLILK